MKMPSVADALSGKWPKDWVNSGGRNYEEMPIGRVFADAVLLPTGQVRTTLLQYQKVACCCVQYDSVDTGLADASLLPVEQEVISVLAWAVTACDVSAAAQCMSVNRVWHKQCEAAKVGYTMQLRVWCNAAACAQIAILNGAQKGVPGGGIDGGGTAKEAASMAVLYDPEAPAGSRITTLASSGIHRWVFVLLATTGLASRQAYMFAGLV